MDFNLSTRNISNGSYQLELDTDKTNSVPRWCEIVLIVYMFMTSILAICGNCIILLVETNNRFKTSTDWLVCSMAANDILFATYSIPMYITINMGFWAEIASDMICKLHFFVEEVTMFSSTLLLGTVAIDRYYKTCRPRVKFLTPTRAFYVCIGISTSACLLNGSTFAIVIYDGISDCTFQQLAGGIWIGFLHSIFVISYLFMFVTVCVCYIKIAYTIKTKLIEHRVGDLSYIQRPASRYQKSNEPANKSFKLPQLHRGNKVTPITDNDKDEKVTLETLEKKVPSSSTQQEEGALFDHLSGASGSNKENTKSGIPSISQDQNHDKTVVEGIRNTNKRKRNCADARVDRTTKIMFAVTLVFLLSWIPTWGAFFYNRFSKQKRTAEGDLVAFFARNTYMVNTFMNPIFYIWMSSVFKKRTQQTLENLLSKCGKRR